MIDMSRHNTVLAEVSQRAAMMNGQVVLALFKEQPFRCDNCEWSMSAAQFGALLPKYSQLKIKLHRCINAPLGSPLDQATNYWMSKVIEMQERLRPCRPCRDCMKNFNPTHRLKYGQPSFPQDSPPLEYLNVN